MWTEKIKAGSCRTSDRPGSFQHEAFLYEGDDGFLAGTVPFLTGAVAVGAPALAAVSRNKIDLLEDSLGRHAQEVAFLDMEEVGRNPGRLIATWAEFVATHGSDEHVVHGIGEPVWPERTPEELVECMHHEQLLNVAFHQSPPFRLLCPYDQSTLSTDALDGARASHPHVLGPHESHASDEFIGLPSCLTRPDGLSPPPPHADQISFDHNSLAAVRELVTGYAGRTGLDPDRIVDLNLAVNEVATNSIRHGGGEGVLRMWADQERLVCQVADAGHIEDALAGRLLPPPDQPHGRGLWIAHHVCDLVQIRSSSDGTVVRLQMLLPR